LDRDPIHLTRGMTSHHVHVTRGWIGVWPDIPIRWTGADKGLDRVGAELERGDRGPRDKPLHGPALGQDRPAAGRHKRGPYGLEYVVTREELERARRENPAPVTVVAPNPRSSKG